MPNTVIFSCNPAAVCVIKGTRFWGTPIGSSPMLDDWCAPIGLKYLNEITFRLEFILE